MQGRLPQLDAVRGVAILLVVLHNEAYTYPSLHLAGVFANGWMGVDLFFVLSGFLITGMLLDTKESPDYFKNFYARRCLRIWPLYFSLLLLMFVVIPVVASAAHVYETSSPWWAYPIFLQNFLVSMPTNAAGPLGVTWSLAIEEQFYLVWPWAVRFLSTTHLRRVAIAVICLSPAVRVLLHSHYVDLYSNTFSRLDGLMAGALIAVVVRSANFIPSQFVRAAWILFIIALPLAFIAEAAHERWIVFSLSAAASAGLVYLSLYSEQKWLQRALRNRFMIYTGTISYGLYLVHKLPFDFMKMIHFTRYPLLMAPVLFASCYGLAALSWHLLEGPFLRLKRLFDPKSLRNDKGDRFVVAGSNR